MHGALRTALAAAVVVAGAAGVPAPARAETTRVAVVPLSSLTERAGSLAAMESQIAAAVGGVRGMQVITADEVRAAVRKARRHDLDGCDDAHCLAEIGRLTGADVVVAGEAGGLSEGQVVYLKAIEVSGERETGSTTLLFRARSGPGSPAEARVAAAAEARAAAYRLLSPKSYTGALTLKIDVPGAQVYVDGHVVGTSPVAPLGLAVGTHALRITHPRYRDFVRFVEVKFDAVENLAVDLTAYPVLSDTMRETESRRRLADPTGPTEPQPWYHKWWAVAGFTGAIVVSTAILVVALHKGPARDAEVTVNPPP
jgi:PEGA domain-containing protein